MKNGTLILLVMLFLGCSQQEPKEEVTSNPEVDTIQELLSIAKTSKELSLEDRKAYLRDA
ncbi:hypothetical protein GUA46_08695 [Muricauda sp. HICW]|uniref:Uncharacterized protein n=1 Tax=Flagellimonas chongwuensis TaxID=2697365 RepID=A0A850NM76_9FLAO|nr:hypothetical protein [Allomuricauda chongwuensis]NVN18417.1 hypothetical protein [Allomuricauda chongwuensis]